MQPQDDPHAAQPLVTVGPPPGESAGVVILIHGRNAAPANILDLVPRLDRPGLTYLAPAAAGRAWYPLSFLAAIEKNEPYLTSAIRRIEQVVAEVAAAGVPHRRIALAGFSQGACLAAEFAYRYAQPLGALVVFSGGLIGPPGTTWPGADRTFEGMPVFLGCSDVDAHVPKTRVDESARVFSQMGATVTERIYEGMGHLVNDDEIASAGTLLDALSRA